MVGTQPTPHILMSVSKIAARAVAGVLVASGRLEPDRRVDRLVAEIGWDRIPGRDVSTCSDMRAASPSTKTIRDLRADHEYRQANQWVSRPGEVPWICASFYRR